MDYPIKSAIILMIMSFAGGIYVAIHDSVLPHLEAENCSSGSTERTDQGSAEASGCIPGPASGTTPH
jgi:hypothetical protein